MTSLSDKVARVKELDAKRTQGEWQLYELIARAYEVCIKDKYAFGGVCVPHRESDAAFIAHAPQMAALINELWDENQKQREVLVMAREAIKGVTAFASAEAYQNGANAVTAVDNVMKVGG